MSQFDEYTAAIITTLTDSGYHLTTIYLFRRFYNLLRLFLDENHLEYSPEIGTVYKESLKENGEEYLLRSADRCLLPLDIAVTKGKNAVISFMKNPFNSRTAYHVSTTFLADIESYGDYLHNDAGINSESYIDNLVRTAERFAVYLEQNGIHSFDDVNFDVLEKFHSELVDKGNAVSYSYKRRILDLLITFLKFRSHSYKKSIYLANYLEFSLHPTVMKLSDFSFNDRSLILSESTSPAAINVDVISGKIDPFVEYLVSLRYSRSVTKTAKHAADALCLFLAVNDLNYTDAIAECWIKVYRERIARNADMMDRAVYQFKIYLRSGIFDPHDKNQKNRIAFDLLPDWFRNPAAEYIELRKREGMENSTITMIRSSCTRFGKFLIMQGITDFSQIDAEILRQFNEQDKHSTPEGKSAYNSRIRLFLRYLDDCGIISLHNMDYLLPCSTAPRVRLVKVLTDNDQMTLLENVHRETSDPMELRDQAMVLLGLKMGLRGGNIAHLKFEDINWNNSTIRFIQEKTLMEIVLPMPVSVGNALYRYIMNGRPESDSDFIFISHTVPYSGINRGACLKALRKLLPDQESDGRGFHVLRKTFATNLLREGNSKDTIINVLGHSNDYTVDKYLSIDSDRMSLCPLSLEETGLSIRKEGLLV